MTDLKSVSTDESVGDLVKVKTLLTPIEGPKLVYEVDFPALLTRLADVIRRIEALEKRLDLIGA